MHTVAVESFEEWRDLARQLLNARLPPTDVQFRDRLDQPGLFDDAPSLGIPERQTAKNVRRVPVAFLDSARIVACHRDAGRFQLLYRLLWRLSHGEPRLLEWDADDDVRRFHLLQKAVRRDVHKMHAFVRFRRIETPMGEQFVAWHCPDHHIVPLAAPFFARRFPEMNWAILTPDQSVAWDGVELTYGPGVSRKEAPPADELEELWRSYYGSIFNPARIKLKAMKKEMPVRHWATLPEAALIPQLLADAPRRVQEMIARQEGFARTAADFFPAERSLTALQHAAATCQACDLCRHATQTVFGEGPSSARLILVGEQPGDMEDRAGRPFVGPAGEVLDAALQEAGIPRTELYLTNTVKHFKFEPRGTQRLHKKPSAREVAACRPWVDAEVEIVAPRVVLCLGATAAQALIRRDFKIQTQRGEVCTTRACSTTIATYHPSAVLRATDPRHRDEIYAHMLQDLKLAWALAAGRT
ncbi:MAG TPA: UdgX family uracil-DNA binding protein [Planctomycetaceae bacterium]|nr:UdgX family uracil-DNA binding protein [Planctomycetaceae bacterium]